jgi:hypothetical protein
MNTLQEAGIKGIEPITPTQDDRIRVGIQGHPGRGKTVSAATFPNPIWLELENVFSPRLIETIKHIHGIDVTQQTRIPIHNEDWIKSYLGMSRENGVVRRRDAIKKWINEEATKIPAGHTLVLDTWTTLQSYFDVQTGKDPKYTFTKQGDEDWRKFWQEKIDYSEEIMNTLMNLRCHVVILFHESPERDVNTGKLLEKVQPMMQGKFPTYMKKFFPNYWRAMIFPELEKDGKTPVIDPVTKKVKNMYMWQTGTDAAFDSKCEIYGLPMYVPAHYQSIVAGGKKG